MKKRVIHGLLALCFACGIFYLRERSQPPQMTVPVTQVFSYLPEPTKTPLEQYGIKRKTERKEALAALEELSRQGDDRAGDYLMALMDRNEKELAVEGALAAMGQSQAVCAVREGAVSVFLQEKLESAQAQAVIELCEKITGAAAENIFLLDECGYLW